MYFYKDDDGDSRFRSRLPESRHTVRAGMTGRYPNITPELRPETPGRAAVREPARLVRLGADGFSPLQETRILPAVALGADDEFFRRT